MQLNPPPLATFNPEVHCFVRTNSLVQLNHLERFNRPVHLLKPDHTGVVSLAASYVEHLLSLDEQLIFPSVSDLASVDFYGSKFAGIDYARQGLKTRNEADEVANADAEEAWHKLMRGEMVEPQLNRIGGRGKLAKRAEVERMGQQLDKGRLVMMTGHRDLKLNGVTEEVLTGAYKSPSYPIAIGQSWWHGGVEEFLNRFRKFEKFVCFDAKKFDASLPGWLIKLAIRIVRSQFHEGEDPKFDTYWDFVYRGLVEAPMFIDNGLLFRRFGGTTSGHNHNTLIQSVCTLIIFYTALAYLVGEDDVDDCFSKVWAESLGDDQVGGFLAPYDRFTKEEICQVVWEIFGVDWSGDKSFETDMLVDVVQGEFQGLQFLGKYFRIIDLFVDGVHFSGVVPYRPTLETLLRLLYPEHDTVGVEGAWERAIGHYADGAGNDTTREYLEKYLDWLQPQVPFPDVVWSEKWRRKFNQGNPTSEVSVPTRRISYLEWLGLVLN
jgi:hypothetical protein